MMPPMPSATKNRGPARGRRTIVALVLAAGVLAATPHSARADDDEDHYDARVLGYSPTVESKSSSVVMTWVLAVLLAGGTLGVMFMNPKRSHLD